MSRLGAAAALVAALILVTPAGARAKDSGAQAKPFEVKVLVLNFDPIIPSEGGKRLHEVCGWNDPRKLAEGYIADIKKSSHGLVRHRIVEWKDIDTFHTKIDGFTYTPEQYMECHRTGKGWHDPDTADYQKTFRDFGVLPRIDSGEIDEVWFMAGGPTSVTTRARWPAPVPFTSTARCMIRSRASARS